MNKGEGIQLHFFDLIRQHLPAYISMVHEVAEVLEISYDSAYRRLRGEKELSMDELKKLSTIYNISIDTLFNIDRKDTLFNTFTLSHTDGFEQLLKLISDQLARIQVSDFRELIMVSRDLPIFYFFNFPALAAFKLLFWRKILVNNTLSRDVSFDLANVPADYLAIGNQMLNLYLKIPSVEIWNQETFTRIMQQIAFCSVSGFFRNKQDAVILFEDLTRLINNLQIQAELGAKCLPENLENTVGEAQFNVYTNEIMIIDNIAFAKTGDKETAFLTYNSMDVLVTHDPLFCGMIQSTLARILKTGNHISGTSALERNRFFSQIYEKLEVYKTESLSHHIVA